MSIRHFATAIVLAISAAALVGCAGTDGGARGLPEFPAEKTGADFPGMSYPSFEGPLPRPGSIDGPVWLLAVDGAEWAVMEPLLAAGALPNLARLIGSGTRGVLRSEEPTISPALWATVATGLPRFEHGIANFVVRVPGSYETVAAGPSDRTAPALWDLVGAAGGRSAVVGWFGSYPAEEIAGYFVSKGVDPEHAEPAQVHPDSLALALRGARVDIPAEHAAAIARTPFLQRTLVEDARSVAALHEILDLEQPDLVALHLALTDVAQHTTWRHFDPSSQQFPQDGAPDAALAGVIPACYRWVDEVLGGLLGRAPAGTTFVLLSDHGAGPMLPEEAFHLQLEVLLEKLGLQVPGGGEAFAISELYRHDKRIWLDLAGFEPAGTVPVEAAPRRAAALAARLAALRTDEGQPVFSSIVDLTAKDDWRPGAPALVVRFSPHALLAEEIRDGSRRIDFAPVRLRHTDVSGAHRPDGFLVLAGPGVAAGRLDAPVSLYSVAPTVLHLLGLPQDRRMLRHAPADGGVLVAALRGDRLERHPVRMVAEYPDVARSPRPRGAEPAVAAERQDDPAAADGLERLRSLGYIR